MKKQATQRERRTAHPGREERQSRLGEQSEGNPVAEGGNGVVSQGDLDGESYDFNSKGVYLIYRKAAGTLAVMRGQGAVLIENQAGRSFIKSS